jgi:hypothetical protein
MRSTDEAPVAVVRHIDKNHVTIAPARGYRVIVFSLRDGSVEAVLASDDGSETSRLLVASPGPTQNMAIKTLDNGIVDILYSEKSGA